MVSGSSGWNLEEGARSLALLLVHSSGGTAVANENDRIVAKWIPKPWKIKEKKKIRSCRASPHIASPGKPLGALPGAETAGAPRQTRGELPRCCLPPEYRHFTVELLAIPRCLLSFMPNALGTVWSQHSTTLSTSDSRFNLRASSLTSWSEPEISVVFLGHVQLRSPAVPSSFPQTTKRKERSATAADAEMYPNAPMSSRTATTVAMRQNPSLRVDRIITGYTS